MTGKVAALLAVLALAPAADAAQPTATGRWQRLPAAPARVAIPFQRASAWTGSQLVVFGRAPVGGRVRNVAAAYTPATRRWRMLSPPLGPNGSYEGSFHAVWTGTQVLVWGPFTRLAYSPAANRWTQFARSPIGDAGAGLVVWTGKEMLGWGGGCCGDASNSGAAYDPAKDAWRRLAEAPIAGQQSPVGAWTGRELVVLPGRGPEGKPTGGGAYDPKKDSWRRIAAPPKERLGASAVWDGRELLVAGGAAYPATSRIAAPAAVALAYDPQANRWRTLAAMDEGRYGRLDAAAVWTGRRLLLWGGETAYRGSYELAPHGLSYDPTTNRWAQLPEAPLLSRLDPVGVWTGKALLVWGGDPLVKPLPGTTGASDAPPFLDGATYTP